MSRLSPGCSVSCVITIRAMPRPLSTGLGSRSTVSLRFVSRLTPDASKQRLQALFGPLGPGIVIARELPPAPAAWRRRQFARRVAVPRCGDRSVRPAEPLPGQTDESRRWCTGATIDGFATVMQTVPALSLRGKTIRLRRHGPGGAVCADSASMAPPSGYASIVPTSRWASSTTWRNRPIRSPDWRQYEIEGAVADDATSVAFGAMCGGAMTAEFEAVGLAVRDASGAWTPIEIKDPGFEDSLTSTGGWFRAGTSKAAVITRPTGKAPEGQQFLRIAPPAGATSSAEIFDAPLVTGAHADIDLRSGLKAGVPARPLRRAGCGRVPGCPAAALEKCLAPVPSSVDLPSVDVRLADVLVAWNVFRHFYAVLGRGEGRLGRAPAATAHAGLRCDNARRPPRRDAPARRRLARWSRQRHGRARSRSTAPAARAASNR